MHLGQNLEDVHGELAALGRLRAAEGNKVLHKDVLLFEFGVDLGQDVSLALEQNHRLVVEVKRALDGGLETLEVSGRQVSLRSHIEEVLLKKNTAKSGDLGGSLKSSNQGLG